jgi:hypothetical protein
VFHITAEMQRAQRVFFKTLRALRLCGKPYKNDRIPFMLGESSGVNRSGFQELSFIFFSVAK